MTHSTPFILASVFSSVVGLMFLACSSSDTPAAPPTEAGADSGIDAADSGGAVACGPELVPGFTPKFHAAAGWYQGKCTSADIESMIEMCTKLGLDDPKCVAAKAAAPSCFTCFFSSLDAAPSAPILLYPSFYDRNIAGCIGLVTGDSSATSCAAKAAEAIQCGYASCLPTCPITSNDDFVALDACTVVAKEAEAYCKPAEYGFRDCANALPVEVRKVLLDVCFEDISGGRILTVFKHYAELFCGSSPDAGTDAGDGG